MKSRKSEAKRVIGFTPPRTAPGVPSVIGIIEFESGASAIDQSPTQRQRAYWEIDGTKGAIVGNELQLHDGGEIKKYPIQTITGEVEGKRTIIESRVDTSPPVIWENPLTKYGLANADDVARAAAYYSIYRAVVEDIEPEYGAENARKDMEILIAIRESAKKGSLLIELPLTEITEYERGIHESYRLKYGHEPLEVGRKEAKTVY